MTPRRRIAAFAAVLYLATIVGANAAVHHIGIVSVGFGQKAPVAVYFVAAAMVLRDLVQWGLGRVKKPTRLSTGVMIALIAAGALLSLAVTKPEIATASALAFLFSELVDYAVFSYAAPEGRVTELHRWAIPVYSAGTLAAFVDSVIFLHFAFHSYAFLPGQLLGKTYGIVIASVLIAARRRKLVAA